MKKITILLAVIVLMSFTTQQTKSVTVTFTVEELQLVYDALGELPAKKVEGLRFKIYTEATRQLADTVKKK